MKKLLSILLSVILLASLILTGCSSSSKTPAGLNFESSKSSDNSKVVQQSSDDAEKDENDDMYEYYECGNCNGKGETECSWCNGSGVMGSGSTTWSCPNCGGDGVGECIICDGSGVRKKTKSNSGGNAGGIAGNTPIIDDYGNQGGSRCPKCNGTGKTSQTKFAPNYGMGQCRQLKKIKVIYDLKEIFVISVFCFLQMFY